MTPSTDPAEPPDRVASRYDAAAVTTLLVAALALRVAYVLRFRIGTDEPQHLHVAWAWTQGLLQYRDVFDNHAPLFHVLLAPVVALVGERPDILMWMRLAMVPLSALTVWCTYLLGRALFSRAVGLWAAALLALAPRFFLTSVEFRADTLWAALWLAALCVALRGRITPRRAFAAGFLLGADLAVSLKSIMCLLALAVACGVLAWITRVDLRARALGVTARAAILGFVAVPAAVVGFFAAQGALRPLLYGTIGHNVVLGFGTGPGVLGRVAIALAFVPPCWLVAHMALASTSSLALGWRRGVLAMTGLVYMALLESVWPLETAQDYQVAFPILAVFAAAVMVDGRAFVASALAKPARARFLLPLAAVAEIAALLHGAPLTSPRIRVDPGLLADVLRLTRPADLVMDLKGETVFRRRPFYYGLESLTLERLRRGLIADTIPERLIATRTPVAVPDSPKLPPRGRAFLRDNYIPVGRLRVLGRSLPSSSDASDIGFDVVVPAAYAIVSPAGAVTGTLDAEPYDGPRFLAAGRHVFRPRAGGEPLALVWAPAIARGFSPFAGGSRS